MPTLYQKNMSMIDNTKIDNIFDTVDKCFIPLDERNVDYKNVLKYLKENNLSINDLDVYGN